MKKTTTNATKITPADAYVAAYEDAAAKIDRIRELLESHRIKGVAKGFRWDAVGDLARLNTQLGEIYQWLGTAC